VCKKQASASLGKDFPDDISCQYRVHLHLPVTGYSSHINASTVTQIPIKRKRYGKDCALKNPSLIIMDALIYSENQATDQPNSLFCKG